MALSSRETSPRNLRSRLARLTATFLEGRPEVPARRLFLDKKLDGVVDEPTAVPFLG